MNDYNKWLVCFDNCRLPGQESSGQPWTCLFDEVQNAGQQPRAECQTRWDLLRLFALATSAVSAAIQSQNQRTPHPVHAGAVTNAQFNHNIN